MSLIYDFYRVRPTGYGPSFVLLRAGHSAMYTQYSMCKTHNPTVFTCQGPFCIFIAYSEETV